MPNVDFARLKASVSIEKVVTMLGIKVENKGEQLRGDCPICQTPKAFVCTPSKGLWNCFRKCGGGDMIALVSKVRKIGLREAALAIQELVKPVTITGTVTRTVPEGSSTDRQAGLQKVLERLQPEHDFVQAFGISPETAKLFESGYNPSGTQRGRYSIAIRSFAGELVGFMGLAPDQSPSFPPGFEPERWIFNSRRVEGTDVRLCPSVLDLIRAVENGTPIESVIAFLTHPVSAQQLEQLSSFMDDQKIESLWL